MTQMMETLARIEDKIDNMSPKPSIFSGSQSDSTPLLSSHQTPMSGTSGRSDTAQAVSSGTARVPSDTRPYFTAPHRTVIWPTIYSHLTHAVPDAAGQLASLAEGGTSWLITQELNELRSRLPIDFGLPSVSLSEGSTPGQTQRSLTSGTSFPTLTVDRIQLYTDAYFSTFNAVYPILDERLFTDETLPPLIRDGFRYGDAPSVLALFVLALGQLAADSLTGAPVDIIDGQPSGICGGSASNPPGLDIFNEGRVRIGSLSPQYNIMSVQVLLLQAKYFEANACHVEYWRSIVQASMICQIMVQNPGVPWQTPSGDLVRRAFWACLLDEDFYHLDLDLPRTSIGEISGEVSLPNFPKNQGQLDITSSEDVQDLLEFYFSAKISLQRVIKSIHDAVQLRRSGKSSRSENLHNYSGPPENITQELVHQLEEWREKLPGALRWSDQNLVGVSRENPRSKPPVEFTMAMVGERSNSHITRAGAEILAVELRARFYYAQFILGRPFIFKALHFPEKMTVEDAEYCARAIQAACSLPIALSRARYKKRLLPHLFTWTQNFVAILSIIWITRHNECLRRICEEKLDSEWVREMVAQMLHWIQDVRQIDSIAEWSWRFLRPLFSDQNFLLGRR